MILSTFNEVDGLLQSVGVLITVVEHVGADLDGQDVAAVDVVDGEEHALERLDAALGHDLAADEPVVPFVHHHKAAENNVTGHLGHPLYRPGVVEARGVVRLQTRHSRVAFWRPIVADSWSVTYFVCVRKRGDFRIF